MLNVCVYISHTPKPFLRSSCLMTKRGRFKMLSPNVHITGSFLANFSLLIIKGKKNYHSIDNHGFNQCLEKFSFELKFKIFFLKLTVFDYFHGLQGNVIHTGSKNIQ